MARSKKRSPSTSGPTPGQTSGERPEPPAPEEPAVALPTLDKRPRLTLGLAAMAMALIFVTWWLVLSSYRVFCFSSVDVFWIMRTGQVILESGQLPRADIYSFTNLGKPWVLYQWLFEVVVGLVYQLGGLKALQALVLSVASFTLAGVAFREMTRSGVNYSVAWLVTSAASAACFTFISVRPHLVSILCVYTVARLLDRHWTKADRGIFWLVPLFLIWANCHLIFTVGLSMAAIYWGSSLFAWLQKRGNGQAESRRAGLLGAALALSGLATLINPYGWSVYLYGYHISSESYWSRHIGEMLMPEFNNPILLMILGYIAITVISFMVSARRPSLPEGLVYVGLFCAALTSYKLLPYFVAATMQGTAVRLEPALSSFLGPFFPPLIRNVSHRLTAWTATNYYVVAVVLVAFLHGITRLPLFPPWVPVKAADWLSRHPIGQHLYCSAKYGSYLIYRFEGKLPVFIDTRFDMYGPAFSQIYHYAEAEGLGFEALVRRYKIDGAFVQSVSGIVRYLDRQPDWLKVYQDYQATIFVRKQEMRQPLPRAPEPPLPLSAPLSSFAGEREE